MFEGATPKLHSTQPGKLPRNGTLRVCCAAALRTGHVHCGDGGVRQQRKAMRHLPHMVKLTNFAADLREHGLGTVPDFDPLDGGVDAQVLFLLEKPGPMTSEARGGSGFISRNNDDPTAEVICQFMARAGVPRKAAVIWNVIPCWNGTRKVTARELRVAGDRQHGRCLGSDLTSPPAHGRAPLA